MDAAEFADVLRRAQGGDGAAFNVLFRDVQPRLLRYLATIAGPTIAEDVASDTWLAVVRDLQRFVGDDVRGFRAWVLSIARRRWIDDIRRRSRRPETLLATPPEAPVEDNVASAVDRGAGTAWALAMLATLPPDQAEVLALRVIADLDVAQTAEIVGKTPGAVRVLAHRGLRKLATQLQPPVTHGTPADG